MRKKLIAAVSAAVVFAGALHLARDEAGAACTVGKEYDAVAAKVCAPVPGCTAVTARCVGGLTPGETWLECGYACG